MEKSDDGKRSRGRQRASSKFQPHWWAAVPLILLAVGIVVRSVMDLSAAVDSSQLFGRISVGLIVLLLVTVFPAWVVFQLSRSQLAGSVACAVLCLTLGLLVAATAHRAGPPPDRDHEAMRSFTESLAERRPQVDRLLDRALAGEQVRHEELAILEDTLAQVQEAAHAATGNDRVVLKSLQVIMAEMYQVMSDLSAELDALESAGGLDVSTFTGIDSIADRRSLIDRFEQANDAAIRYYADVEANLRAEMMRRRVPESAARQLAARWAEGARPVLMVQLRQNDHRILTAWRGFLNTYRDGWGVWEVGEDGIALWPGNHPLEAREENLWKEIDSLAEEELRLLQRLVESRRARVAKP